MKIVDAKCPGIIDLYLEGNIDNHVIRRDFVDTYDTLSISAVKKRISDKKVIKPVLEAGLLFFKELDISGYKLEASLTRNIPLGYNLGREEMLKLATIYGLNYIMNTNLSDNDLSILCRKLNINPNLYISKQSINFDNNGNIINRCDNTDIYYNLIRLPMGYTNEELLKFFMKDESFIVSLDEIKRFEPLIDIKRVLLENDAKIISTNGQSNALVATFDDPHKRFKVSTLLKEYSSYKSAQGQGYSMLRINK